MLDVEHLPVQSVVRAIIRNKFIAVKTYMYILERVSELLGHGRGTEEKRPVN